MSSVFVVLHHRALTYIIGENCGKSGSQAQEETKLVPPASTENNNPNSNSTTKTSSSYNYQPPTRTETAAANRGGAF